jgi:SPP1 gp7 family putative phage head morphogenesis protein
MHNSLVYWTLAKYRANAPEIAMDGQQARDASPARTLKAEMSKRGRLWRTKFNKLAPQLGEYFATAASSRVDKTLEKMLRDAGFTTRFKLTAAQNDIVQATVAQNVTLITNLADQHLSAVEGLVMRSVQTGRDMATLSKGLQEQLGVSKRRAALIARHQNNLATATLTRSRHIELGVTKAKWLHSAGGKTPRPEHVAFSGKTYDIASGAFLEGKHTWPGVEINCRCVSIPIIPELGDNG